MKNLRTPLIFLSVLFLLVQLTVASKVTAQGSAHISFDVFYDELDPYGDWIHDSEYGEVWYPDVGADFRPYGTNGSWTMTEYGNTWVSNYNWGWAPFHYGRWVHRGHQGWAWVPGYEWGPGWVNWRSGGGYYGWAPMTPGVSVNVSTGLPLDFWVFIPTGRIYDRHIPRYWSRGRNVYNRTTIINNTYIVNNNHYYSGPSRREIERHTGRRVAVRNVQFDNRRRASRVNNRSVSMFRPNRSNDRTGRNTRTNARNTRASQNRDNVSRTRNNVQRDDRPRVTRDENGRRVMHIGSDRNRNQRGTIGRSTNSRNSVQRGATRSKSNATRSRTTQNRRTAPSRVERSSSTRNSNVNRSTRTQRSKQNNARTQRVERSTRQKQQPRVQQRSSRPSSQNRVMQTRNAQSRSSVQRNSSRSKAKAAPQRSSRGAERPSRGRTNRR